MPKKGSNPRTIDAAEGSIVVNAPVAAVYKRWLAFVGKLIMAWALYGILLHLNMFTLRAGIVSGVLCWFGFVLTTMTVNNAFCGRKPMLTVIDSGAWLGAFVIIGAVLGWMGP